MWLAIRRLSAAVMLGMVIALIAFFAIRQVPGDTADVLIEQQTNLEVANHLREILGIGGSWQTQLRDWLGGILHGDLGRSFITGEPVLQVVFQRTATTLLLAISAFLLANVLGVAAGILAASNRGALVRDKMLRVGAIVAISIPNFVTAVALIFLFAVKLGWLPSSGYAPPGTPLLGRLEYMILPSISLALILGGVTMRMMRGELVTILNEDYVRTAISKGLSRRQIVLKHGVRNAMVPVVTVMGIQLGRLLSGAIVIENVFSIPGLGTLLVGSIENRDYAVLQGCVLMMGMIFVLATALADIAHLMLSPQVRDR